MQATNGDNDTERPMWAEKGGLDFEGRARWDAWTAVKGTSHSKAMLQFVKVIVASCAGSYLRSINVAFYVIWTSHLARVFLLSSASGMHADMIFTSTAPGWHTI